MKWGSPQAQPGPNTHRPSCRHGQGPHSGWLRARTPNGHGSQPTVGGAQESLFKPADGCQVLVCILRVGSRGWGVAGCCPGLWSTLHKGPAVLSYWKTPPHTPMACTYTRTHVDTHIHWCWSTYLAGTGAPQVHTGAQPHTEHVERRPVHQVQVEVILQLRCI